jgi:hypothetical protein
MALHSDFELGVYGVCTCSTGCESTNLSHCWGCSRANPQTMQTQPTYHCTNLNKNPTMKNDTTTTTYPFIFKLIS